MEWTEHLSIDLVVAITITIVFVYAIYKHRANGRMLRRRLEQVPQELEPIEGSAADLAAAEAELAVDSTELRKRILDTHELIGRYSTLHGYSEIYLSDLQRYLADKGLQSTYLFQQTLMSGQASYTGQTGVYEFYVERDRLDEGHKLIEEFRSLNPS